MFFRGLNGKSPLGKLPLSTGECRHSPPSVICLARPDTVQTLDPVTKKIKRIVSKTVIANEIKTVYALVDEKDSGCSQYCFDWNKEH